MDPLIRLGLIVLIGPVSILLVLFVTTWYRSENPTPPDHALSFADPFSHRLFARSLDAYRSMPEDEQRALRASLNRQIIPLAAWLDRQPTNPAKVICLGEYHRPATRRFLAETLFPSLPADALLLEGTDSEVSEILRRVDRGRPYFPLLGVDIAAIVRTVRQANPDIQIIGVEETDIQWAERQHREGSRDRSITENVLAVLPSQGTVVVLYGAMHCSDRPNRLFGLLQSRLSSDALSNVQVLGMHQDASLHALAAFVAAIGLERTHFVIPDTDRLDPRLLDWFPWLERQSLSRFEVLIAFWTADHTGE